MTEVMSIFIAGALWVIAFELDAIKQILEREQAAGGSAAGSEK